MNQAVLFWGLFFCTSLCSMEHYGSKKLFAKIDNKNQELIRIHLEKKPHHIFSCLNGRTPLDAALDTGSFKILEITINAPGMDERCKYGLLLTTLEKAKLKNNIGGIIHLLDLDINPTYVCRDGNTLLTWACQEGHSELISNLLCRPAIDLNQENNEGKSALAVCLDRNRMNFFTKLIEVGANPQTALESAVRNKKPEVLRAIFDAKPHVVTDKALAVAIQKEESEVVNFFFERQKKQSLNESFRAAFLKNRIDLIQKMIKDYEVDLNQDMHKGGRTGYNLPIDQAIDAGNIPLVQILLLAGVKPRYEHGRLAVHRNNSELFRIVLSCGLSPSNFASSVIKGASLKSSYRLFDILLEQGLDVNILLTRKKNSAHKEKKSPLHIAICAAKSYAVDRLIHAGANVFYTYGGKSALEWAVEKAPSEDVNDYNGYGVVCGRHPFINSRIVESLLDAGWRDKKEENGYRKALEKLEEMKSNSWIQKNTAQISRVLTQ